MAVCEVCGKSFASPYNLIRHLTTHTKLGKYVCCGERFADRAKLKRHRGMKHNEYCNYVCEICGKAFTNQADVNHHQRCHDKTTYIQCSLCTHKAKCMRDLKEHMAKHTEEKRYQCNKCFKRFKFRTSLSRHLKRHNE